LKECREHEYSDEFQNCRECHESCGGCHGPEADECNWCDYFQGKYYQNGRCISCLDTDYFDWESSECKPCSDFGCRSCDQKDECFHCLDDFFFYNMKCFEADLCPIGTEADSIKQECAVNVSQFDGQLWDEEDINDTIKVYFEMKFIEEGVELDSYMEFRFPENILFQADISSCHEIEDGDALLFDSQNESHILYKITRELDLGSSLFLECTQLTEVFFCVLFLIPDY
jgi:hypothetical protein